MGNYNWREFVKRITIRAEPGAIQHKRAWKVGSRLAEFRSADGGLRKRNDAVQQGDHYRWLWFGYDGSFVEENDILEVNGKDRFEFVFSGGCKVAVTVKRENGETICELRQVMPMDDESEQRHFFISVEKDGHFI